MRFRVDNRPALAFVLAALAWTSAAAAQTPHTTPPAGHLRNLTAQWAAVPPVIDGVPSDTVWTSGAAADDFWVSDANRRPQAQTRVVVLFDDHALYFAFTCLDERPDLVRATQIRRDAAPGFDDRVTVEIDPFHNHRSVSRFTVTARGTQSDALAGGRAKNRQWKGEWRAAARRTPSGWTAEIAIPFALLEFDPRSDTFGINFSRFQNRTRERSHWANLTPQKLAEEAGHLTGLRLPDASGAGRLAVMQYMVGGVNAAHDEDPNRRINSGLDLRYQWAQGLTSVVSTRPDFSGVETEVPELAFSYSERLVRDNRPFFQEGGEFFGDREVFYSSRIDDFDVAAKTFGRLDDFQVGVLATSNTEANRTDYVGHVVREVGPAFNVSATAAATHRDALDNTALQLQAGGRVGRHVAMKAAVAHTSTDGAQHGVRGRGEFAYSTPSWHSAAWVDYTDTDYMPANGFLAADVIGTTGRGAHVGYLRTVNRTGIRRADATVSYDVRDTMGGRRQREMASFYAGAETAANIQVNAGMTVGAYRARGAQTDQWADTLSDDRFYTASAFYNSPTGQFGGGAHYSWGIAGVHDYTTVSPSLWLAPNPHLSMSYSFERAAYDAVQQQHVVAATWQITGEQSLAGRWVDYDGGYYRVSYRRALARGLDAFGAYTSDPYNPGQFSAKVVWTLVR